MTIASPHVTITETALQAFRGVADEANADDVLRLSIDDRFRNELFFGPREPNDVVINAHGITLAMNRATATRANGLTIDFVDAPGASGFKLENPNESPAFQGIRPADVRQMLAKREKFELVDVRRESERAIAMVKGSRLLEEDYEAELLALPKNTKLVFMCHHSSRSRLAAQRFVDLGFTNVWYMVGGIDAWSTMDPSVPRY